ncbi:MAG: DUF1508 domain-containing protein [Bacillus subtilis]|nr:DUF1508 domain-containing protein [Bacillus subtilis]
MSTGEFYETDVRAQSAIESVKKFVGNDKIIQLDEIPVTEVREELVKLGPVVLNDSGKIEIALGANKEWTFTLKASNGEVLFESNGYASKPGAARRARIRQEGRRSRQLPRFAGQAETLPIPALRFQRHDGPHGETYPNRENCESAVDSVRRFLPNAKIVDKPAEKK